MLNKRQIELYEYLKKHTQYVSAEDIICAALHQLYPTDYARSTDHLGAAYATLRADVRAINASDLENIIVSSKKGYKIATKEEAVRFVEKRMIRDLKSLKINWNLKRKIGNDGQHTMTDEGLIEEIKTYINRKEKENG